MMKKRKINWYLNYWTKSSSGNDENVNDFWWSDVQEDDE